MTTKNFITLGVITGIRPLGQGLAIVVLVFGLSLAGCSEKERQQEATSPESITAIDSLSREAPTDSAASPTKPITKPALAQGLYANAYPADSPMLPQGAEANHADNRIDYIELRDSLIDIGVGGKGFSTCGVYALENGELSLLDFDANDRMVYVPLARVTISGESLELVIVEGQQILKLKAGSHHRLSLAMPRRQLPRECGQAGKVYLANRRDQPA
jgi:hypothetical protein